MSYQQAVEFATRWLEKHAKGPQVISYELEPTEIVYALGVGLEHQFDDHQFCPSKYVISDIALNWLCMTAERDKGAFELVRRIAISKLLRNEPLSMSVSLFAGMVLAGLKKSPPPESQRLSKTFARNLHLVYLARSISRLFGLALTRNDSSGGSGVSACDAISDALENLDIFMSPRAIKDLLVHKSSLRVREIADEIEEIHRNGSPFLASMKHP
ncbi:hypothetical protein ACMA5I_13040 [Paracoccaceae bacterium GXU_MW_L88]